MPGYISEFNFFGTDDTEFVEVAIPAGTDTSTYEVYFYQANGTIYASFSLGSPVATMSGYDIYLIDAATPGFESGGDSMGMFYADDAIALYDGSSVVQFSSWAGNTVTATEGPAAGATSTNVGTISTMGNSLQSDDGGASYYEQSNTNEGSIPACYAQGTLIETPDGPRRVETLCVGDHVLDENRVTREIIWVWTGDQALESGADDQTPVLIGAHALGKGQPCADLIVSPHHRMLLHGSVLAPAKALTGLRGIRRMRGKRAVTWVHFACEAHHVVTANGARSESLLLGPMVVKGLARRDRLRLIGYFGADRCRSFEFALNGPAAYRCLTVRETKAWLEQARLIEKRRA